jgi:hypothetical protein
MNTFPNWLALMELWLQTHHKGLPAVIFSQPCSGDSERVLVEVLKKHFGDDLVQCVGSEFAVLVCATHEEASRVMRETPENNPYTLVWDGAKITGHH